MSAEPKRTCPSCGNVFSGAMEFCLVCMLRKGLGSGIESGESSTADTLKLKPVELAQRFDHYELLKGKGGKPERRWLPDCPRFTNRTLSIGISSHQISW
jgi:hypothetical protein